MNVRLVYPTAVTTASWTPEPERGCPFVVVLPLPSYTTSPHILLRPPPPTPHLPIASLSIPLPLLLLLLCLLPPIFYSSSIVNILYISAITNYPLWSSFPHLLCSVWSDPLTPIRSVFSDMTQSNIIFSFLFYPLTLLFYDYLYPDHSNPTQSSRLLFPDILSPLWSSEHLILLKITYH